VQTGLPAHAAYLVGWSGVMQTIGVISDTHGLLRPQALAALAGCDAIIHAGDVGSPNVLARLGALTHAPRRARKRRSGRLEREPPVTQRIEIDGFRIYVLHILAELDPQAADNVDAVIYGNSHQPKIETKNGTLFFGQCRAATLPPSLGAESPEQSEQCVLALAPMDRKRSRPIRVFSATPHDGQRSCRTLAEDPVRTQPRAAYPQRRSSNANSL
jgi:hypothetical protein